MEAYRNFAAVYDILMQDVDYEEWASYITSIWDRLGVKPKTVLDLGCGTGTMAIILAKQGYELIGVDYSAEMLSVASQKAIEDGCDILLLNQSMAELELYAPVDCMFSVFDSINYIVGEDELAEVFRLVKENLKAGGIFIFDVNTEYKYKNVLADNIFARDFGDCAYIWDNYYDAEQKINEYEVNLFIRGKDELFEKFVEYHYQRAYSVDELTGLLAQSGLEILSVYDAYSFDEPKPESERIFFVCRG